MKKPSPVRRSSAPPSRTELIALLTAAGLSLTPLANAQALAQGAKDDNAANAPRLDAAADAGANVDASHGQLIVLGLPPDARVTLDGQELSDAEARAPIAVTPGPHALLVSSTGGPYRQELNIAAGETVRAEVPSACVQGPMILGGAPPPREYETRGCCGGHESPIMALSSAAQHGSFAAVLGALALSLRRRKRR